MCIPLMSKPVVTVTRKNSMRGKEKETFRATRLKREPFIKVFDQYTEEPALYVNSSLTHISEYGLLHYGCTDNRGRFS